MMNLHAVRAIFRFEMARTWRTLMQSVISPVISTSLYFIVFGAAIGSRIPQVEGVSYGAFIVPGLIMLSLLTQSVRHLLSQIQRHDLRTTLSPGLCPGSRVELRRCSRHKVDHARADYSAYLWPVCAATSCSPVLDAPISRSDLSHLQPGRFHYRHLGGWLREATGRATIDHHALDLSGW